MRSVQTAGSVHFHRERTSSACLAGCGTGADAVYLVKHGFEVTAVDSSPTAIERARVRAEQEDALPRFVLADIFEFAPTAGQFGGWFAFR